MHPKRALDGLAKISGRLMAYVLSDSTVNIVFLAVVGAGNASPVKAKNVAAAEKVFLSCGLTAELAAAMCEELSRNHFVSIETSVNEEIAGKFQYRFPHN
jgi:hypothetical protein